MSNLFSGFSNTGVPIPTIEEVEQATRNPTDNIQIAAAIQQSAQEFPPAINTGAFFAQTVRGPILPPYGTKGRDKTLRLIYRNDYNSLVQGVVSAIVKKFITTPWNIGGNEKIKVTIRGADGRLKTISAIEHYQLVFQNAQFGMGWEFFCQQFLEDFFCQDFGAVCELIGPGEPIGPVDGAITGIAHLDSGRCYITGNPYYPIFYWSLISGSLHRMHASRIVRFVDAPSPDERFFGIGLCALSRAIAISNRQMLMTRYIEGLVDDKPKPGIMLWQGITDPQLQAKMAAYLRDLQNDALPSYGKTIHITSVNVDQPISATPINFAQTPEKFNWIEYNSLDVDAIALAFGIDRQDIWELAGRSLGSAMQSQVLADKAAGKMIGFLFQNFERMINRRILPREFEFQFKRKDAEAESKQAAINLQLAQTVAALAAVPGTLSPQEGRDFLSNSSDGFKDILTNKAGQVTAQDASESEQVSLEDANPIDISQTPQTPAPVAPAKPPTPPPQAQPSTNGNKPPVQKAFGATAQYFRLKFADSVNRAIAGQIPRSAFENNLIDALSTAGTNAFTDGLHDGGVDEIPDEEEQAQIQDWIVSQLDFVDGLADQIYAQKALTPADVPGRSDMWVNKSLSAIRDEGRAAADKNAMFKWLLGPTEKHCKDCARLDQQVHRYKEWYSRGWLPQADKLTCKGFQCQCKLVRTDEKGYGGF